MPFLSIVIPTRQRPELLALALESAINQTFDDYEVVVSANGDPEETRKVVERFPSPRVSYVEIGEDVDAYTSWHYATRQSRGEYMLLLADDDALVPTAMESYAAVLQANGNPDFLSAANAWYGHPSVSYPRKNSLRFRLEGAMDGISNPAEMLALYYAFQNPTFSPTYVLVSRKVLQSIEDRGINPYTWPYPDYGMQACALGFSDRACLMSEPTVIHGYAADSAGDAHFSRRETVVWKLHNGEDAVFERAPLQGCYYTNGWAETLLRARDLLPEQLGEYQIDWETYYARYAREMAMDAEWRDISDDLGELCRVLMNCEDQVKVPLLSSPNMVNLLDWLKRMVDARLWEQVDPDFGKDWLPGEHHGFENIAECSKVVTDLYHRQRRDRRLYNSMLPPR